tara:strand:+ start:491 stop:1918 length:1428 start_codon:yes stop_codon:yes gene_type:complete
MDINKISTEKDLLAYIDKHPTVKSSLIGTLVDKCEELFETDYEIASIVYRHTFFRKKEKVLKHCAKQNYQGIISEMINIGVQNLDIELLSEIDKWFIEREDEVLKKIFSNKLRASRLFDCLMYFDKTSKIFAKAKEEIENIELSENELIVLINSLNQIIYRISSIKLIFLKDDFGSEIISNSVYDVHKSKAELEYLRIRFLKKALKRLRNSWKLILILEFIFEEDLEKLKKVLDISIIEWFLLEQKITDQIPFSEPTIIDFFGIEEYYPEMDFPDVWERFETSNNPFQLFIIFELLKLKIILTEKEILVNELDFKKLLNNTLTAYYVKGLHDLGILTKIPKMSEVFKWPNISLSEVKLYLSRFEKEYYDESPLKKLGYQVGKSSELEKRERQNILRKAFKSIPAANLEPYKWGTNNSPKRLESIATHLAHQIKNFRRIKTRNYFYAIQDWKDDLDFLKSEFYDDKCADAFIWVKV